MLTGRMIQIYWKPVWTGFKTTSKNNTFLKTFYDLKHSEYNLNYEYDSITGLHTSCLLAVVWWESTKRVWEYIKFYKKAGFILINFRFTFMCNINYENKSSCTYFWIRDVPFKFCINLTACSFPTPGTPCKHTPENIQHREFSIMDIIYMP